MAGGGREGEKVAGREGGRMWKVGGREGEKAAGREGTGGGLTGVSGVWRRVAGRGTVDAPGALRRALGTPTPRPCTGLAGPPRGTGGQGRTWPPHRPTARVGPARHLVVGGVGGRGWKRRNGRDRGHLFCTRRFAEAHHEEGRAGWQKGPHNRGVLLKAGTPVCATALAGGEGEQVEGRRKAGGGGEGEQVEGSESRWRGVRAGGRE